MLKECMEVFEHEMKQYEGEKLILDTYVPVDGTYLIVDAQGNIKASVDVKMDKATKTIEKTNPYFPDICFYDYHSQLLSMNKRIDTKKIIHSNNYLSFFVKKDSIVSKKLTKDVIEGYYETLKYPVANKYKNSKEAAAIYKQFSETEGEVDEEAVERNKKWIQEHIFSLNELEDVNMERKDYIKIFFEEGHEVYEREGRRYFLPNLYNNNKYNVRICGSLYGVPDNNICLNSKKPFLYNRSRKFQVTHLLDRETAMLQKKLFNYLKNQALAGHCNIYVDTDSKKIRAYPNGSAPVKVESGYYLRINKGKTEVEILIQDNLSGYRQDLDIPFYFENVVSETHERYPEYTSQYHMYNNRLEVGQLINEVLFSNWLASNYFIDAGDISIPDDLIKQCVLLARDAIHAWVYRGLDQGFSQVLEKASLKLIKGTLLKSYGQRAKERALHQFNLRWSLLEYFSENTEERGRKMAEIYSSIREKMEQKVLAKTTPVLENDQEYYYAVGQLVAYLIYLSKAKEKNQSLVNPFLNAASNEMLKMRVMQLYKKYNYAIKDYSKRLKNMVCMIESYVPEGETNQDMILLGYASDNLIFTTEDKKDE